MTLIESQALYSMREPCKYCQCRDGRLTRKGGQDVIRCAQCGEFVYNAPKDETGTARQSLASVREITPKRRADIFALDRFTCQGCGRRAPSVELTIGHAVTIDDGHKWGLTKHHLNSYFNLFCQCAECNAGQGAESMPAEFILGFQVKRWGNAL